MIRVIRRLYRDERGSIAAYAAVVALTAIGAGARARRTSVAKTTMDARASVADDDDEIGAGFAEDRDLCGGPAGTVHLPCAAADDPRLWR
jgi:hypothetical protein